jgi:hypothetical protein
MQKIIIILLLYRNVCINFFFVFDQKFFFSILNFLCLYIFYCTLYFTTHKCRFEICSAKKKIQIHVVFICLKKKV